MQVFDYEEAGYRTSKISQNGYLTQQKSLLMLFHVLYMSIKLIILAAI